MESETCGRTSAAGKSLPCILKMSQVRLQSRSRVVISGGERENKNKRHININAMRFSLLFLFTFHVRHTLVGGLLDESSGLCG